MPPEEITYRDRVRSDIENLKNVLELRMGTFEISTRDSLQRLETKADSIEIQTKKTNGKVRKIIVALIFIFGLLIGQTFSNTHDIIQLVSGML